MTIDVFGVRCDRGDLHAGSDTTSMINGGAAPGEGSE